MENVYKSKRKWWGRTKLLVFRPNVVNLGDKSVGKRMAEVIRRFKKGKCTILLSIEFDGSVIKDYCVRRDELQTQSKLYRR